MLTYMVTGMGVYRVLPTYTRIRCCWLGGIEGREELHLLLLLVSRDWFLVWLVRQLE
jgi:hypothetical protein